MRSCCDSHVRDYMRALLYNVCVTLIRADLGASDVRPAWAMKRVEDLTHSSHPAFVCYSGSAISLECSASCQIKVTTMVCTHTRAESPRWLKKAWDWGDGGHCGCSSPRVADLFPLLQQLCPLLSATGRMDIQRVPHCDEIQICEWHAEPTAPAIPISLFKIKRITFHSYHFATLIFDFQLQKVTLSQFALVTRSFTTKKIRLEAVRCSCIVIHC